MRRHTIGVGDSQHEVPQDVRAKLAQHKPILGMAIHSDERIVFISGSQ